MNKPRKNPPLSLLVIAAASALYGAGVSLFLDPNQLAPGGITGLSVILSHVSGLKAGILFLLLNIPIVLLGIWKFGLRFMLKTAYAIALTSFFTDLFAGRGALTEDLLLAGVAGGILLALGIGLIFRAGGTTGGTDIIVKLLRRKYRYLKTGFLFQCIDVGIVSISGLVFRDLNLALYALLAVFTTGRALDYVLYGGDEAKMFYVITSRPREIGSRLLKEARVGVTYLEGRGGWTGKEKQVVFCMTHKRMGPQVEEIVREEDEAAFLVVTSASEIYGKGYKDFFEETL